MPTAYTLAFEQKPNIVSVYKTMALAVIAGNLTLCVSAQENTNV